MTEQEQGAIPRPDKEEVIERMETARAVLLDALRQYDDAQLSTHRDAHGWNAIDHLTHLTAWERSMVFLLNRRPRHEGLGVDEALYLSHDLDRINSAIRDQHQGVNYADAMAAFDAVHAEMRAVLDTLTTDELQLPYSHFLPDEPGQERGEPVWAYIAGNTMFHYDDHGKWIAELIASPSSVS